MAITLQGTFHRILMPDGTYLLGDSSGFATSGFFRFQRIHIFTGTSGINGDTTITFPYAFPNAGLKAVVSEQNAGGWGVTSVTGYGIVSSSTTSMIVRGFRKFNGGTLTSPASGISCNWVAIGY
jgi:hypothetical protein